ncbi:MAG TPA: hypothetical protein VFR40_06055 [Lapillicoccus sp.]|nr:hypothetical protein [Lapillicoccus sp.]
MNTHTTTRIAAAGLLAAAAVLTTSGAPALAVQPVDPAVAVQSVDRSPAFRLFKPNLQATVQQLLDEGRQATTVAERRLVHQDLVQTVIDGE